MIKIIRDKFDNSCVVCKDKERVYHFMAQDNDADEKEFILSIPLCYGCLKDLYRSIYRICAIKEHHADFVRNEWNEMRVRIEKREDDNKRELEWLRGRLAKLEAEIKVDEAVEEK